MKKVISFGAGWAQSLVGSGHWVEKFDTLQLDNFCEKSHASVDLKILRDMLEFYATEGQVIARVDFSPYEVESWKYAGYRSPHLVAY